MSTVLGLDLGTSSFKVSAYEESGRHLGTLSRPTLWESAPGGPQMDHTWFSSTVRHLVHDCARTYARGVVVAIGVTGMAETVFIDTPEGRRLPARAWNTGPASATEPDPDLFAATGLLDASRTPAVQLRAAGQAGISVSSWAGLPERAVQALGGRLVAERSLAARTGLVDVLSGDWSPTMAAWAGMETDRLLEIQPAGEPSGTCDLGGPCAGAILTVAGHDHLAAAVGAGADDDETVFDSLGTGEALIARMAPSPETVEPARVAAFNTAGFNVGLGLSEHDLVALGGLGTGNRFNVVLTALTQMGFRRDDVMLAEHSRMYLSGPPTGARLPEVTTDMLTDLFGPDWRQVRDSGRATNVLRRTIVDQSGAREVWWAAVVLATEVARSALTSLRSLLPGLDRLVATGGWLSNPGIRRAREGVLGPFEVPDVRECGTRGAALLAGYAGGLFLTRADFPAPPTATGVTK